MAHPAVVGHRPDAGGQRPHQFLHDGRARNLLEAVLWHGGEAQAARNFVLTFNAEQRAALLAFLNSL